MIQLFVIQMGNAFHKTLASVLWDIRGQLAVHIRHSHVVEYFSTISPFVLDMENASLQTIVRVVFHILDPIVKNNQLTNSV
jgi:hypothetical protein